MAAADSGPTHVYHRIEIRMRHRIESYHRIEYNPGFAISLCTTVVINLCTAEWAEALIRVVVHIVHVGAVMRSLIKAIVQDPSPTMPPGEGGGG